MYIKSACITPNEVLAGDSESITIKLVLDEGFATNASRIVFDFPATLGFARPSDFDQEDDGYVEVYVSNPKIKYRKRCWDMEIMDFPTKTKSSFKGMAQRIYVLDILGGSAAAGDEIELKWGISRNGMSIGTKMGTLVPVQDYKCAIDVRYFIDGEKALPELGRDFMGYRRPKADWEASLRFTLKPRSFSTMRAIKKGGRVYVQFKDKFSNIISISEGRKKADELMLAELGEFNEFGVLVIKQNKWESAGLDIDTTPDMMNVYNGKNIYFGDLHTHSTYSNDCIEREKMIFKPADTYEYAKNTACLDFMAVTDHHQPWDIERNKITRENWNDTVESAKIKTKDGEFLAFLGFEFRGKRGDTAVIFKDYEEYSRIADSSLRDIRKVWAEFQNGEIITIPHYHNPGSLPKDEWYADESGKIETIQEVYSCHGSYENRDSAEREVPRIKSRREDRYGRYLLDKGYKYGLACNSDGHKGNPGTNGLTAVYANELTKEAIFAAIRNRHVYGTTNARIRLLFIVEDMLMGGEILRKEKYGYHIEVQGENNIKYVEIICDGKVIETFDGQGQKFEKSGCIEKAEKYIYVRVIQVDNHMAYSSPVFIKKLIKE